MRDPLGRACRCRERRGLHGVCGLPAALSSLDLPFSVFLEALRPWRDPVPRPFSLRLLPLLAGLESSQPLHSLCSFPRTQSHSEPHFSSSWRIRVKIHKQGPALPSSPVHPQRVRTSAGGGSGWWP